MCQLQIIRNPNETLVYSSALHFILVCCLPSTFDCVLQKHIAHWLTASSSSRLFKFDQHFSTFTMSRYFRRSHLHFLATQMQPFRFSVRQNVVAGFSWLTGNVFFALSVSGESLFVSGKVTGERNGNHKSGKGRNWTVTRGKLFIWQPFSSQKVQSSRTSADLIHIIKTK